MGKSRDEQKSKADLKYKKKEQFYDRVKASVAALNATKSITKKTKLRSRQKKLKAYDLSSLTEFLPELEAPRQPAPVASSKLNCKSRQQLILKEAKQLNLVLNHPAFKSDPFGSIHQHLQSTQPIVEEKPKKIVKNKDKKGNGKKSNGTKKAESMSF